MKKRANKAKNTPAKGVAPKTGETGVMAKRGGKAGQKMSIQGKSKQKALFALLIQNAAKKLKLKVEPEYKFCETRRFRFDFAIPELMVAFEYEGIIAGKARHTTITGYTNDCIKYNLAASLGWKVLRYTALNYGQIEGDITNLLTNKK